MIAAGPIYASDSRREEIDGEPCALGSRGNERGQDAAPASSPSTLTHSTEENADDRPGAASLSSLAGCSRGRRASNGCFSSLVSMGSISVTPSFNRSRGERR